MFGLGLWEIVVILLVVFIAARPKDLHNLAQKAARLYSKTRKTVATFTDEIRKAEHDIRWDTGASSNGKTGERAPADDDDDQTRESRESRPDMS